MEDFISHCLIKMADGLNFDRCLLVIGTILACIEINMRLFVSKLDGKVSEINT